MAIAVLAIAIWITDPPVSTSAGPEERVLPPESTPGTSAPEALPEAASVRPTPPGFDARTVPTLERLSPPPAGTQSAVARVSSELPQMESSDDLRRYVEEQHSLLAALADEAPDRVLLALITFETPFDSQSLEQMLAANHELTLSGWQWVASNGVVGGGSPEFGRSLTEWESYLLDRGDIDPGDHLLGVTSIRVSGPSDLLLRLVGEGAVLAVDVGDVRGLDARLRAGERAVFSLPKSLYYRYRDLVASQ